MHYVTCEVIRDCKYCRLLNAGHYRYNNVTICLSAQCLRAALAAIKALIPHATCTLSAEIIVRNTHLYNMSPQHFVFQVSEYILAQYTCILATASLTPLEEKNITIYKSTDTKKVNTINTIVFYILLLYTYLHI